MKLSRTEFLLLNGFHILIDGLFESFPLLLSFMVIYFGGGGQEVGVIVSCAQLFCTAAGLATVYLALRFTLLQCTGYTTLLYGAGFFVCAFAPSLYWVAACCVLALLGHTIFHNMAFSYLSTATARSSLGKSMSNFTAFGDLGRVPLVSFAGFAAALPFAGFAGWQAVCIVYGVLALVAGAALARYASSRRAPQEAPSTKASTRALSLDILKKPSVALAMGASTLNSLSCDTVFVFLPLLLISKGMDPQVIGSFALGFTVGCFVGKMACGRLLDRFGTKTVFLTAQILLAVLLVALISDLSFIATIAVSLGIGVVTKGSVPVVQTIITEDVSDPSLYSDVFTINSFCRGVMVIIAPLAFGFIATRFGITIIYVIMLCAALISTLPVLVMQWIEQARA